MMKNIILCLLSLIWTVTYSQDLHLTNYRANDAFFNPASSGSFQGLAKVGLSLRTQYERTYEQGLFHADANFFSPLNKKHWLSAGIQMLYDVVGSLKRGQSGGGLQSAYHIPLNESGSQTLSAGIQLTMNSISYNTDAYKSENTLTGVIDPDLSSLNQFAASEINLGIGASFKSVINEYSEISAGLAVMNVNRSSYKIVKDNAEKEFRFNIHAGYSRYINQFITLNPSVYASFYGQFRNINLQLLSELKLTSDMRWSILFGGNHRLDESFSAMAGFKSRRAMVCFSADILSGASRGTIANPGAMELSAYYIFYKYTKPVINPVLFCPLL